MKSKLFLSLSLLTAIFSVQASDSIFTRYVSNPTSTVFGYVKQTPSAVSTATSAVCSASKTAYNSMTVENMKALPGLIGTSMVSGYTVSKDFTAKHPLIVGGTITAAAIAFGGYKMYKNRVIAKAKADAEVTRKAQEAKALKAKQDQETARIAAAKAAAAKVVKNPGYVLVKSRR